MHSSTQLQRQNSSMNPELTAGGLYGMLIILLSAWILHSRPARGVRDCDRDLATLQAVHGPSAAAYGAKRGFPNLHVRDDLVRAGTDDARLPCTPTAKPMNSDGIAPPPVVFAKLDRCNQLEPGRASCSRASAAARRTEALAAAYSPRAPEIQASSRKGCGKQAPQAALGKHPERPGSPFKAGE